MYLEHFKLAKLPFQQLPDPGFLYMTDQHDEALTRMQFALAIDDSFAVITGEVGSGKTTLVRKVLSELSTDFSQAFITHTRLTDIQLLQSILLEFGISPFKMGKIELLAKFRDYVDKQHAKKKRVIIVVDEAQNLGLETLEELRLLTCMDSTEEKALNIILIGQPELSDLINSPELEQLRQRCRLRFHLHRLSREQTNDYIKHRMRIAAGNDSPVFDDLAMELIFEQTRGIPRLINTLCDTALMMACLAGKYTVSKAEIDVALVELGWPTSGTGSYPALEEDSVASRWSAVLSLIENSVVIANYKLTEQSYIVGRADDCSIRIDSKYLSRHHAIISVVGSEWSVSDLRSTNGIGVNGKAVNTSTLQNGDVISIGVHRLVFKMAEYETGAVNTGMSKTRSPTGMAQTFVIVDDEVVDGGED